MIYFRLLGAFFTASALILFSFKFAMAQSQPMTLREVFTAAKEKTETIPQNESLVRESEARRDQVFGRFLPSLSLGASYLRQEKPTGGNEPNQTATRITLSQSIFEGGRDKASLSAAESETAALKQNLSAAENSIFVEVARSFFAVLAAEQDIKNIQKSLDLTNERAKELRKRMKVGKTQNVEVLAAEAQRAVLTSQLLSAVGTLNIERESFARISGLSRNTKVIDPMRFPNEPKTVEFYLAHIEDRPDIHALKYAVDTSQNEIRAAQAGHLPSIELIANRYLSQTGFQNTSEREWDLGVTLTIPIFSGGIVRARTREIREQEIQTELSLLKQKRIAEEEIRTHFTRLASSLDQVKSLEQALTATEQNYQEQVKNYRFSQTTNLDVIQALNTLQDTKRTLDRMRFEALTAWAELKAASGQVWK